MHAGTFSAFRVPDCEFSGFAGGGEGACWSISLAECDERCVCHAERKPPHAVPRSPFGKLAIWGIFAAKASRTRKRACDIAGNTPCKTRVAGTHPCHTLHIIFRLQPKPGLSHPQPTAILNPRPIFPSRNRTQVATASSATRVQTKPMPGRAASSSAYAASIGRSTDRRPTAAQNR